MILTARSCGSKEFGHHSVALKNVEVFVAQANPVLIHLGLDGKKITEKARSASFKGLLSSAEAENILESASTHFFKGLSLPGGKQEKILIEALKKASRNNTRVDR